jgi:ethanolamine transporter EutH
VSFFVCRKEKEVMKRILLVSAISQVLFAVFTVIFTIISVFLNKPFEEVESSLTLYMICLIGAFWLVGEKR